MSEPPTDQPPTADPATQPLLHCLDGEPAPPDLGESLRRLLHLPAELQPKLPEILRPSLEPMAPDQLDSRIARLCRRFELQPEQIGPGVKAAVFLFRQGAVFDVDAAELEEDLRAVIGKQQVVDLLLPIYREVFPELRREIAMATITAHGKVLTNVEWRLDTLGSSSRGRKINIPVALVTLQYQDGPEARQITLQMMPDAVAGLRKVCDHLLNH
ncbi:MAG: hypothetical protein JRI23_13935 [Deltaproteobacteria bacterium]|jgi:hypothetical protein|nr:hypothetical protein [Deltaproteobacteria bacterium]MBW2532830.1 hypothetical protein [Deltaproteobacteria bacterium]